MQVELISAGTLALLVITTKMADSFDDEQQQLSQLWKRARKDGCLPPWEQARVYGLNEAWKEMHGDKTYGKIPWIAERVHVQDPDEQFFTPQAVGQLLKQMNEDEDWFPEKVYGWLKVGVRL